MPNEIIVEISQPQIVVEIQKNDIIIEMPATQGIQGIEGPPGDGISAQGEIPTGAINGINTNYSLAHTPTNGVRLYVNGMRQKESVDYIISSNIITFISALIPGDILLADYNY